MVKSQVQFLVKVKSQGLFLSLTTLTGDEDRSTCRIYGAPCMARPGSWSPSRIYFRALFFYVRGKDLPNVISLSDITDEKFFVI